MHCTTAEASTKGPDCKTYPAMSVFKGCPMPTPICARGPFPPVSFSPAKGKWYKINCTIKLPILLRSLIKSLLSYVGLFTSPDVGRIDCPHVYTWHAIGRNLPMIADAKPIMAIRPTKSSFFLVKPKPYSMGYNLGSGSVSCVPTIGSSKSKGSFTRRWKEWALAC